MRPNIPRPTLRDVYIADPPAAWEALGFTVGDDSVIGLGGVSIHLGGPESGNGITAWAIDGIPPTDEIDGLSTFPPAEAPSAPTQHHNAATGIDHVVVLSPDFDRTASTLDGLGMPLRRVRDVGEPGTPGTPGTFRQGFRRLGPVILELVEAKQMPTGPARFWGLTVIVEDLDALAARLADRLEPIKTAVQPGRRIATLNRDAGLSLPVAFMDPER